MMAKQYVRALYEFPSPEPGEIPLKLGDIVEVTGRVNPDWLIGKIGQKTGNFPAAFVSFIHLPQVDNGEKIFAATDNFTSDVDGDLSFKKGGHLRCKIVSFLYCSAPFKLSNESKAIVLNFTSVCFLNPLECIS